MAEQRKFYEVGTKIYYLTEAEAQLLLDLAKSNLLKFTPEEIDIYGIDKGE